MLYCCLGSTKVSSEETTFWGNIIGSTKGMLLLLGLLLMLLLVLVLLLLLITSSSCWSSLLCLCLCENMLNLLWYLSNNIIYASLCSVFQSWFSRISVSNLHTITNLLDEICKLYNISYNLHNLYIWYISRGKK